MKLRLGGIVDAIISFLDFFIHPRIFKMDHFYIVRSRILIFWAMIGMVVISDTNRRLGTHVHAFHPVNLVIYYCILELIAIFFFLRIIGNYKAALYVILVSIYINTPVVTIYTGGLYSPNFIFFLFYPYGVYQLTKSSRLSFITTSASIFQVFVIYLMHKFGWDFASNGFFEEYHEQFTFNLVLCCSFAWVFSVIYSRSLSKIYEQIAENKRYESILSLSRQIVAGLKYPAGKIKSASVEIQKNAHSSVIVRNYLQEIIQMTKQASAFISEVRKKGAEHE